MLRSFLIYLSKAAWARQIVMHWSFAWRMASRFVAGEKLEDAIRAVKTLNDKGINATLDLLGEHTTNTDQALQATEDILKNLDEIDRNNVRANVSVKLTQIGLSLDQKLCEQNLRRIVESAKKHGNFVRIDMEDFPWTEITLDIFRRMAVECSCENVGIVIQSYLYRSADDVAKLLETGARIRLCKGAYKEPANIAYPKKSDVDANYDNITTMLLSAELQKGSPQVSVNGKIPPIPAIASHDDKRIAFAKSYAKEIGLPKTAIEFQMLNGIRRDLQEQLAAEGYPVRIYVPFGTQWYPYFMRRLAERPANVWFFVSNYFRK